MELAVAHVQGDHVPRTPLEQAVSETACRRADVQRQAVLHGDAERVEGVCELQASRETHRAAALYLELDVIGHELPRLAGPSPPGAHEHVAGENGGRSASSGVEEPPFGEERVDANTFHIGKRYVKPARKRRRDCRAACG